MNYELVKEYSDMGLEKIIEVDKAMKLAPKGDFCEIGVRRGGTSILAMMQDNCEYLICVDPYLSFKDMGGKDIEMNEEWFTEATEQLDKFDKKYFFYRSTSEVFFKENKGKRKYAFVLLDGEHTNSTVQMEIDYFSQRMLKDGILLVDNVDWLTLDFSDWVKPRTDMAYKIFR